MLVTKGVDKPFYSPQFNHHKFSLRICSVSLENRIKDLNEFCMSSVCLVYQTITTFTSQFILQTMSSAYIWETHQFHSRLESDWTGSAEWVSWRSGCSWSLLGRLWLLGGDASVWDRRRSLQGGLGMMRLSVERRHTGSVTRFVTRPPSLLKIRWSGLLVLGGVLITEELNQPKPGNHLELFFFFIQQGLVPKVV